MQTPTFWHSDQRLYEMDDRLQDASPDTINRAEAKEYLSHFERPFQSMAPAVHRPRAQWDWPWREQGYLTLLPHLNQMRYLGNVLTYRAKLDLAEGRVSEALAPIRQLYVMGVHAGGHDEAILVEGLVGVGIAAQATRHAVMAAGRPGAPNLYRALGALPDPMFDPRNWVEMEHRIFRYTVPAAYDPAPMGEATWAATWQMFAAVGLSPAGWKYNGLPADEQSRVARDLAAERRSAMTPAAVAYFTDRGADAAGLRGEAAADPYPLLARYMAATMDAHMAAAADLIQRPYAMAVPALRALDGEAGEIAWLDAAAPENGFDLPFADGLRRLYRLRQRIAAAVVLEALRDHAARHGAWPDRLADVALYLPEDPIAGRAFEYRREGDAFTLQAAADDGPNSGFEWRVTLRRE